MDVFYEKKINEINMGKIKILMMVGNTRMGGAQAFILNVLRNIDREKFQIDLAINFYAERDGIEDECRALGCDIHIIPYFKVYNYFSYCKAWRKLFDNHKYDIIYAHSTNSASVFLKIAKEYGCKTIAHSHSAGYRGNMVEQYAKKFFAGGVNKVADYWFACSDKAAERLYGSDYSSYKYYYNIPNAIDSEKYLFDEEIRKRIREQIGVKEDEFLCGHIGTFSAPKNHKFLVEIFAEVVKLCPKSKFVCCGAGALMLEVKEQARELGVLDKMIFPGVVSNANEYLMAMDCFVFPSIFEGFPISILEAEASGMPIIMSDVITPEVDLTSLVHRESLSASPSEWAGKILGLKVSDRKSYNPAISESKYNIRSTVKEFEKMYTNLVNNK